MATQTLAMAKLLIQDDLVRGVAQDIIDINPIYASLPFMGYTGQAVIVNRELTLGAAGTLAVGSTITTTLKAASTFTSKSYKATKIIGDAEMDGLVQAQSESAGVDQTAVEISSKAKNVGRLFQLGMFTGTGSSPAVNSLHSLCDATQYATASATARAISFVLLDELMDLVKAKDGQVDFICMAPRTMRSYKVLLRALGGTPADWVVTLPDGRKVISYESIPIFKSEFASITETANGAALTAGAMTSVWAGVWDDGSQKVGVAGIHPASTPAGIQVKYVGPKADMDEDIWRVKWYVNLCLFNRKGLARLASISD
jgi:hypothetical protein